MEIPRRRTKALSCRAKRSGRRGAVTVELAVVAPVLVILILGTIDLGQFVNVAQTVSNASREGARLAARTRTLNASEVESSVRSYLAGVFPNVPANTLNAAVEVNVSGASSDTLWGGDLTTVGTGSPLSVEVVLQFDSVRWLGGLSLLDNKSLRTMTVMRRE